MIHCVCVSLLSWYCCCQVGGRLMSLINIRVSTRRSRQVAWAEPAVHVTRRQPIATARRMWSTAVC